MKHQQPCAAGTADAPSTPERLPAIVEAVCHELRGNGIYSIGAIAALKAMATHWEEHFAEGLGPEIIVADIRGMVDQITVMRNEILRRLEQPTFNRRPFKITDEGFTINGKICFDIRVAEDLFETDRQEAERATNDRFEKFLTQSEAMFGQITPAKYEALLESFIEIVVKSACTVE